MSTFLIIWFIISFIIESIVKATEGEFKTDWKKVLFYIVIAPTLAWSIAQKLIGKLATLPVVDIVGSWFKS